MYYEQDAEHPFLGRRMAIDGGVSAATAAAIEEEAREVLGRALGEATQTIDAHRAELDRLCASPLEHESLDREELKALLGPRPPTQDPPASPPEPLGRI